MFDGLQKQSVEAHTAKQGTQMPHGSQSNTGSNRPTLVILRALLRLSIIRVGVIVSALLFAWFYLGPIVLKPEFQALVLIHKAQATGQGAGITEIIPAESAKAASVAEAQASGAMPVQVALSASQAEIEIHKAERLAEIEVHKNAQNAQIQAVSAYLANNLDVAKEAQKLSAISYQQCFIHAQEAKVFALTQITDKSAPYERLMKAENAEATKIAACQTLKEAADAAIEKVHDVELSIATFKERQGVK